MSCSSRWWRGGDQLTGSSRGDWLIGSRRDDTIEGRGGNDVIWAGWGDDVVSGGEGDDWIWSGRGTDSVDGGAGVDRIFSGGGDDDVDGGAGNDYVQGGRGDDTVNGGAGDDNLHGDRGEDNVDGGAGNDHLRGGGGDDVLIGGAGDDMVHGGRDDDDVDGGDGNDFLRGGRGDDTLIGGDGDDRVYGGRNDDVVDGGAGNDHLRGGGGDDEVDGGAGNDYMRGGVGDDVLSGGTGDDRVYGGRGDDEVEGGAGNDYLRGGLGDDTLSGGAGDDEVYGGHGDDEVVYSVSKNHGSDDYYHGGRGHDVLVLQMTHAEHAAAKAELGSFDEFLMRQGSGWKKDPYHFDSFGLTVRNFEQYEVVYTDAAPSDVNANPEALADSVGSGVDGLSIRDAESNDPDGQPLSQTAQVIERSSFRVAKSADVGDDSLPRVSIEAAISAPLVNGVPNTNDVDVYAIELKSFEKLILDIDYGFEVGVDPLVTRVFLLDENGNEIDGVQTMQDKGGLGSTSPFDPYLEFTNGDSSATYYVAVASFGNKPDGSGKFTDGGLLSGDYVLNVSIENAHSDVGVLVIEPDSLLANDSDSDGDTLEIVAVGNAKNGEVELTSSGRIAFKPNTGSPGSFDYTVSDGNGGEATATATVNGNAVTGTSSDDVLDGTAQADMFTGGAGSDTFNFSAGGGADTIADFELGSDVIAITDGTSVTGTETVNEDTLVHFDSGDSVLLVGVTGVTDVNDLLA